MITVSWYPGAMKGKSVKQTEALIVGGLQMWQKETQVQFGVLPAGQKTQLTFYPYDKPFNGAMGAYVSTGQIIYSTLLNFPDIWARMAIAHEVAHCFGWGHTSNAEDLMYTRGSSVYYFSPQEGKRAWKQFGKHTRYRTPESLIYLGKKLRPATTSYIQARDQWKKYQKLRDAEKNVKRRQELNDLTQLWYKKQLELHKAMMALHNPYVRIRKGWEAIGGFGEETPEPITGVCNCFQFNPGIQTVLTEEVFDSLPKETKPLRIV